MNTGNIFTHLSFLLHAFDDAGKKVGIWRSDTLTIREDEGPARINYPHRSSPSGVNVSFQDAGVKSVMEMRQLLVVALFKKRPRVVGYPDTFDGLIAAIYHDMEVAYDLKDGTIVRLEVYNDTIVEFTPQF